MRKHLFLLLALLIGLAACQNRADGGLQASNAAQAEAMVPTLAIAAPTVVVASGLARPAAQLNVSPNRDVAWNATVTLTGQDLPAGQTIFFQAQIIGDDAPFILGQSAAGAGGELSIDVMVPAGYFGRTLQIYALAADGLLLGETSLSFGHRAQLLKIRDPLSGFTLTIPDVWLASDPLKTPLGEMILLGPGPLISGDPGTSVILMASINDLTQGQAASLLTCGTVSCLAAPSFDPVEIDGQPAGRLTIGSENTPPLEWYFLTIDDRLIYFTLHDPVTLETIPLLIDSVELREESVAAVAPTATAVPPTRTPPPPPTSTSPAAVTPLPEPSSTAETPAVATSIPLAAATISPTATAAPTMTFNAPAEPSPPPPAVASATTPPVGAGPVQTATDFILRIIRDQIDADTAAYLTDPYRTTVPQESDLRGILQLGFNPLSFTVERLLTDGLEVEIVADFKDNTAQARRKLFLIQEEGRWKINNIEVVDTP